MGAGNFIRIGELLIKSKQVTQLCRIVLITSIVSANLTGLSALVAVPVKADGEKTVVVTEGMHGFKIGHAQEAAPDDTQAIQKIIDDQDPNTLTRIKFPKGYFGISGVIKLHSNLILSGVASEDSKWTNESHMVSLPTTAANGNVYQYKRATWWYPTQAKGYGGAKNVNHVYWDNITFNGGVDKNSTNGGMQMLQAITHSQDIKFDHCDFDRTETAPGHSLDLGGVDGVEIKNSTFRGYATTSANTRKEAIQVDYTILSSSSTNSDHKLTVIEDGKIVGDPKWHINESLYMDGLPTKNVTVTNSRFLPIYEKHGDVWKNEGLERRAPNPIGQHIQYSEGMVGPVDFVGNYVENAITPGKDATGKLGKALQINSKTEKDTLLEKYTGIIHFPNANGINISKNIFRQTAGNPDDKGYANMTMNYNAGRLPSDVSLSSGNNTSAPFTQRGMTKSIFNDNTLVGMKSKDNHTFLAIGQRAGKKDNYDNLIHGIENKNNNYINSAKVVTGPNGNLLTNQLPSNYSEGGNQVRTANDFFVPKIEVKQVKKADIELSITAQAPGNVDPSVALKGYEAKVIDKLDDWQDKNKDPIEYDTSKVKFDKPGTYDVTLKTINSMNVPAKKQVKLIVKPSKPVLSGRDVTVNVGSQFDVKTALNLTVRDDVDGDLTGKILLSGDKVDPHKAGTYHLTATVKNSFDQQVSQAFTVTVGSTQLAVTAPSMVIKTGETFSAREGITAKDASGHSVDDLIVDVKSGHVETSKPGLYHVTYDVHTKDGLSGQVTRVVTVTDEANLSTIFDAHDFAVMADGVLNSEQLRQLAGVKPVNDGHDLTTVAVDTSAVKFDQTGDYPVIFTGKVGGQLTSQLVVMHVKAQPLTTIKANDFTVERGTTVTAEQIRQHFKASHKTAGNVTDQVSVDMSGVNTAKVGIYPVKLTYTDANGTVTKATMNVMVASFKPMTLNVKNITVTQGTDLMAALGKGGFTAEDPVDGSLKSQIKYETSQVKMTTPGTYVVVASVTNSAGETARKAINVEVKSDVPEIKGPADMTMPYGRSAYTTKEALQNSFALDPVEGDLSKQLKVTGAEAVNTKQAGKYQVTYTVTNKFGNQAKKVITITVAHAIPTIKVTGTNSQGYLVLQPGTPADILKQIRGKITASAADSGQIDRNLLKISEDDANLFNNGNYQKSGAYTYNFEITNANQMTGGQEISFIIANKAGQAATGNDNHGHGTDEHGLANPYLEKSTIDYQPVDAANGNTFEATNISHLLSLLEIKPDNPSMPFRAELLNPEKIDFKRAGTYHVQVKLSNGLTSKTVDLTVNVKGQQAAVVPIVKDLAAKLQTVAKDPVKAFQNLPATGEAAVGVSLLLSLIGLVSGSALIMQRYLKRKRHSDD